MMHLLQYSSQSLCRMLSIAHFYRHIPSPGIYSWAIFRFVKRMWHTVIVTECSITNIIHPLIPMSYISRGVQCVWPPRADQSCLVSGPSIIFLTTFELYSGLFMVLWFNTNWYWYYRCLLYNEVIISKKSISSAFAMELRLSCTNP